MSASSPTKVLQRTPEWLDARLEGIGSSEAAAALGVSRWESRSRLWAIKLRFIPQRDPSVPMLIGTATEDLNAQLYQEKRGIPIRRERRMLRSKAYPWMQASLDRRAADRVVEMKYSNRADGYGEPGTDEVPDEVLVQVVHQMIVTGLRHADVSLLTGTDHRLYEVGYDDVAAQETIEREREFWRAVEERREPPLTGPSDADDEYLLARYPRGNGELVAADPEDEALLVQLRELQRLDKGIGADLDRVKTALRAAIGEADGIEAAGVGRLRWHRWPGSELQVEETDWQSVANAYRELLSGLYGETPKALDALLGIHTNRITKVTKKAGSKLGPAEWEEEALDVAS